MISVNFFEHIVTYRYMLLEGGTVSNILYTKVKIDDNIYNYYQLRDTIIITDSPIYDSLHDPYDNISINKHLNWLDFCKRNGVRYYVKINGKVYNENEYLFIDNTRFLKLKKILNNDRLRNIIKKDCKYY